MTFYPAGPLLDKEAPMTMHSQPTDDRYTLTLHMPRKYQRTLRLAAVLAKEMGMIEEDSITGLMNLFVNLGLEYIKREALG